MTTPWNKKGIVVSSETQPHFIDHLVPVASLMNIPILFLDERSYELGRHYYPNIQAKLEDNSLFSLEYLIKNYDVSFMAEPWNRNYIQNYLAELENHYQKKWQNVFCPHGFSDKGFYFDLCYTGAEVYLIYGNNQIDLLKGRGMWRETDRYVTTGNYRFTYYKQHTQFYEEIFQKEIASRFDKKRPIILYAPTWQDLEQSSSFEEAYSHILDGLPSDYNLIVKVHPRFEIDEVIEFQRIIGSYEHKKNIHFLSEFPPVFPLLAHAEIYIGDMSSIGYDFLAFDKPLFLLNKHKLDPKTDRRLFLYRCATEIKPEQYSEIYKIIENNIDQDAERNSSARKEMWEYSFGEERLFSDIRADIIEALRE